MIRWSSGQLFLWGLAWRVRYFVGPGPQPSPRGVSRGGVPQGPCREAPARRRPAVPLVRLRELSQADPPL